MRKIKKSHIINILLAGFILLILLSPDANAWMRKGLMKTGLFRPSLEVPNQQGDEVAGENETTLLAAGNQINSVAFLDSEGVRYDAASLKGKVVFINFWATWCPPCIAEMPSIDKLYQRFKDHDKVVFLMVDVDNKMEQAEQFMQDKKLGLPVHVASGSIPEEWLGRSIPTTVILDKKGLIAARHEGMADYGRKEVFDFMSELIAE